MFTLLLTSSNLALLKPLSSGCRKWLKEHVQPDAQWWAGALVVEYRYLDDLVAGLEAAGFKLQGIMEGWQ